MCKKIITIFLLVCCFLTSKAQAQVEDTDSTIISNDLMEEVEEYNDSFSFSKEVLGDTMVYFRTFEIDKDSISSWKNNKKYAWHKNIDSLLKDKQKHEQKSTSESSSSMNNGFSMLDRFFNSPLLKILLWLLAGCFVAFILYKLFLSKGLFGKATKKTTKETELAEVENISDNDFDKLLRKAYTAGDLRLAMRYLFLKLLQKLNDKELIHFASDKTNSNYAKELPVAKRNEFASLALYYEYIWYGNTAVQNDMFDKIEIKFNDFLKKV
jgi:hypothetical protein